MIFFPNGPINIIFSISSDNGLAPNRQAITWTNDG